MDYETYHKRVVEEVRKNLTERWAPMTEGQKQHLDKQVLFFDRACDYRDEFARGDDPEEVAEANIEAADWS